MWQTTTGPPAESRLGSSSGCADRSVGACDQLPDYGTTRDEVKTGLVMRTALIFILLGAVSVPGIAQTPVALDLNGKLRFHAEGTFSPASVGYAGLAAGFYQMTDSPAEWGQGASGFSKRFGSSVASSGIRGVLALGLDSTLHQDPRYFPSRSTGFWRRAGHALRGTIFTRTDGGGETLSTWRLGSAYGAAFISNRWYPDRYHTVRGGFADGSVWLGFDFANNMAAEFWPDIRRKISRRKP
jgi:hypothetical protein